ncbi:MAG: hypothetical protein JXA89_06065 [Anaerolineae bacterium]|nr:hypothetical protein [Anaerolineae bacterium]
MSKPKTRVDKSYVAPELTAREKVSAGLFTALNTVFFLYLLSGPILMHNLFSRTYPRRAKLINAILLLLGLALTSTIMALVLRRALGHYL